VRFQVLGPLEATHNGRTVQLGGIRQRATLAFLLLKPNQVVPTSHLLDALWPEDDAPASARKMLQNAVWSLRSVLASTDGADKTISLVTQRPGYMLRLDPEQVDLYRFLRKTEEGRVRLTEGAGGLAAELLKDALSSWRGNALSDLVESGISWPELEVLEKSRTDAMEDYLQAELACGRHRSVLGELESMVEREPLRERLCAQLMTALYRCGRHADALSAYSRMRIALVEDLGLEPSPELQNLQHAILVHDPALAQLHSSESRSALEETRGNESLAGAPGIAASADMLSASHQGTRGEPGPAPTGAPAEVGSPGGTSEHQYVSVVTAHARLSGSFANADPAETDDVLSGIAAIVQASIEQLGGIVAVSLGSSFVGLFGVPGQSSDDAELAARAALMIRDGVSALAIRCQSPHRPEGGVAIRVAVVTGDALMEYTAGGPTAPPSLDRALISRCQDMLFLVPEGEVLICGRTHQLVKHVILSNQLGGSPDRWQLESARPPSFASPTVTADNEHELALLHSMFNRTVRYAQPHVATILSECQSQASVLLAKFMSELIAHVGDTRLLTGRVFGGTDEDAIAALSATVSPYCGISHSDSDGRAGEKLLSALRRVSSSRREVDHLFAGLLPMVCPGGQESHPPQSIRHALVAWQRFLMLAAADQPLVVAMDSLHLGSDDMLRAVEEISTLAAVPLLVVVTAQSELLDRHPRWGSGLRHSTVVTLVSPAGETTGGFIRPERHARLLAVR